LDNEKLTLVNPSSGLSNSEPLDLPFNSTPKFNRIMGFKISGAVSD